jgi:hypothetical protein
MSCLPSDAVFSPSQLKPILEKSIFCEVAVLRMCHMVLLIRKQFDIAELLMF